MAALSRVDMFGKPMNDFIDYRNIDESANEGLMIERRTFEIQRLFQDYIKKAKLNIEILEKLIIDLNENLTYYRNDTKEN
jgi:hypothetical protein